MSAKGRVPRVGLPGRAGLWSLLVLGVLCGSLVLMARSAGAFIAYPPAAPSGVFGAPGSGDGQLTTPTKIAVNDSSGDVYVLDEGNNRVEEFDAEGHYLAQFNGSSDPHFPDGFSSPVGIAVDNSTGPSKGDVYIVDGLHNGIDKFSSTGVFITELVGFTYTVRAVAVDPTGNVFGVDEYADLEEFNGAEDNSLIASLGRFTGTLAGAGLAVDANDDLYVLNGYAAEVEKFSLSTGRVAGTDVMTPCNCVSDLAIDPSTNELLIDQRNSIAQYGPFGEPYALPVQIFGSALEESDGVAVNGTTGVVYASQAEADTVAIFKPGEVIPDVATGATSNVVRTGAKLEGVVNPDGLEVTSCEFEYGTSTAYGQTVPCSSVPGSGSSPVAVSAEASGLTLGTTYHYRLVAGNSNGSNTLAADRTFTTCTVSCGLRTEAADVPELSGVSIVATVHGTLGPDGVDTHYYFEYGETEAYGSVSPALPGADAGEAFTLEHIATRLVNLAPYSIYHYRIVASNEFGNEYGADMTLNTSGLAPAPVVGGLPASNVTQFTATLNGKLETGDYPVNYHFEYGPTTAYGQSAPLPDSYTPLSFAPLPISQPLTGLQAGTTYHYRLVASSPGATEVKGPDETFTTLPITAPAVQTGAASGVGVGSAMLSGTVDPYGWDTSYLFQYGTSTAYGQSWPTVEVDMGALEGAQPVLVNVPNLLPSTTYHYRLIATNGGGTSYGPDMTFTTGEYQAQAIQEPVAFRTLLVPSELGKSTTSAPKKKTTKGKKKSKKGKKSGKKKRKVHHAAKHGGRKR